MREFRRLTRGEYTLRIFDGQEVTGLSGDERAHIRLARFGFVFQFHHLLPEFNALENVMMPGLIQGKSRKEMEGPARALLEEVRLGARVSHRPGELSGGEQQRVALARALVMEPRLLLADEPTGNLDRRTGAAIHDLLLELNRERGMTLLVVTHNEDLAVRLARQVRMVEGRLVEDPLPSPAATSSQAKASDPPPPSGAAQGGAV